MLRNAIEQGECPSKILQLSDTILQQNPSDSLAVHSRAVALLVQSGPNPHKVSLAVECFNVLRDQVNAGVITDENIHSLLGLSTIGQLVFQHAYALYRLNKFEDVIGLVSSSQKGKYVSDQNSISTLNLLAQSFYNLERFADAAAIYENLLNSSDDEDQANLVTNLTACYAAMGFAEKCESAIRKSDEKLFEHLLNGSTSAIEAGDVKGARLMLDRAEQLLRSQGQSNGVSSATLNLLGADPSDVVLLHSVDREYADDYALVLIQRAYLSHRFDHDVALAERILKCILKLSIGTQVTTSIAAINLEVVRRDSVFFDTYRTLKQVQTPAIFSRLSRKQRRVIQFNTALLLMNLGKIGESRRLVEKISAEHGDWASVRLLLVALLMKGQRKGTHQIESELANITNITSGETQSSVLSPSSFKQLVIAQIRLDSGDLEGAVDALASDDALLSVPAVLATLCDLQSACGRITDAARLLLKSGKPSTRVIVKMAEGLVLADAHAEAIALLKTAQPSNEVSSVLTLAETFVSTMDAGKVAAGLSLPPEPVAARELDSDEVDAVASRLPSRSCVEKSGFYAVSTLGEDNRKTKNRRRPMRYPCKTTRPDGKIDYERWLPLSIRTYYRDLPERRKKEMRRLRREEQAAKRKQAGKRKGNPEQSQSHQQ